MFPWATVIITILSLLGLYLAFRYNQKKLDERYIFDCEDCKAKGTRFKISTNMPTLYKKIIEDHRKASHKGTTYGLD